MSALSLKKKLFGDKAFYKMVLLVAVPIMIQNGFSNFVSLLDNIMVGRLGTEEMSGVSIVNQLLFVYFLCLFGGLSGAGIFTAQYYGQNDDEGVRNTFRFKLWMAFIITVAAFAVFVFFGEPLISYYLTDAEDGTDIAATMRFGKEYLKIILIGLPPIMIVNAYDSTLRDCGETILPMKAGIAAVLVNLVLNYLLIYGKFGFPELGVSGAAIATVVSRYVEAGIVVIWSHLHSREKTYIKGLYKTLRVPKYIVKKIMIKGTPLLINETLWAAGMAMLTQCYSTRGLNVIAGINISNTLNNIFNIVYVAMGDAVAIIVGQLLGAGKKEEAKITATRIITFAVLSCLLLAGLMAIAAPFFPQIYNTTDEAKGLATSLILIIAAFMPSAAFMHASYFTLRSGGKTIITFLFDSCYLWVLSVPVAYVLSRFTDMNIILLFTVVQSLDLIKCVIGFILVKKGVWIQNIVSEPAKSGM